MKFVVKFNGEEAGSVLTNHSMSDDEILELAGIPFDEEHGCFVYDGELVSSEDFEIAEA